MSEKPTYTPNEEQKVNPEKLLAETAKLSKNADTLKLLLAGLAKNASPDAMKKFLENAFKK